MTRFNEGLDTKSIDLKKRWNLNDYALVCSVDLDEFSEDLRNDILEETFLNLIWEGKESRHNDILIEIVMPSLGGFDCPPLFHASLWDLILQEVEVRSIGPMCQEPYQIAPQDMPSLERLLDELQRMVKVLKRCIASNAEGEA